MKKKISLSLLAALVGGFLVLQVLPLGRVDHPPVVQTPVWDSARTAELAQRACYDCHSNETSVPWYGQIAPFSWLVADHVAEGRQAMNLSEMHRPQEEAHEAGEEVLEGEMPPAYYVLLHPEARLSAAEKRELAAGLDATLGGEGSEGDHGSAGEAPATRGEDRGRRRGRSHDDDHDDDDDDDD